MTKDRPIDVCLVEAQRIFQRALRHALEADGDIQIVVSAPSLRAVGPACAPDVVVVDLDDQPAGAEAIASAAARRFPGAALCLIATRSTLDLLRCRDAGGTTLVLKDRTGAELREAVRLAARGTCTHDERISARIASAV